MWKKIIFIFIFIFSPLLFWLIIPKVNAEFHRYPNNPIIKPEYPYEINGLYAPTVVFKNNQYYLWYSSLQGATWTISLATSSDGYSWTKFAGNPVIRPDTTNPFICEKGAHDPEVLWNENLSKFQIWYVVNCESQPAGVARYWVKYGESTDGINWTIQQAPVLSPTLSWEQEGISFPAIIIDDQVYKMWYGGRDSFGNWKIGYATSPDGKNWTKHLQNPIISPTQSWEVTHIGGSDVIKENGIYKMYYHGAPIWPPINLVYATSTDGINWEKPNDNPIATTNQTETKLSTPDIIKDNQGNKLYYSTIINGIWQISLLTDNLPTPTPTPTPGNSSIILIPGFLASWNKEAILHNQPTNYSQWQINPIVKEYDGIISSLNNLGFIKNQNFFIFTYDWRKNLNSLADDFNNYLNQLITNYQLPTTNFSLIGHSLGGLVARIYSQKYGTDRINKLLTIGSPHQGTAHAYKAAEAGEIDRENNFLWLAEKIILILNKKGFETDKETINNLLPIVKDLLPTYNFLKNQNNQEINVLTMKVKNNTLLSYQENFSNIFSSLRTLAGEKGDTLFGFKVGQRTIFDQLLDLYPDGRPIERYYQNGDLTVTLNSAKAGNNPIVLNLDHGEIIYKKEAIKKIFETLDINYQESQIIEGRKTNIFPSLIFLLKSPAEIEAEFNSEIYPENEGMIFIENAQPGDYILRIKGKENGRYTVIIGQLTADNDLWTTIEGEISQNPPTSQVDIYRFNFNPQSLQFVLSNLSVFFDELILYLNDLNKTLKINEIAKAITNLNQGKQFYQQNNKSRLKSTLLLAHQQLFLSIKKVDDDNKNKLLYAVSKLENLYDKILGNYFIGVSKSKLTISLNNYKRMASSTEKYLLTKKQQGKNVTKNSLILLEIKKRLNLAEESLKNNNLNLAEILLKSVEELLKEVRKI